MLGKLCKIYFWLFTEAANHFFNGFRFAFFQIWTVAVNDNTVHFPINGLSEKRTPLISGQFHFPLRNSGQTLIKDFLKTGQVISGHSV